MNYFERTYKDVAVNCKTKEDAKAFLSLADDAGISWIDGTSTLYDDAWGVYRETTCYRLTEDGLFFGNIAHFTETEIEIVEFSVEGAGKTTMTKNDLRNGMVVETRNGNRYIVIGDMLIRNKGAMRLESYNDNLNDILSKIDDFDIVKVFSVVYRLDDIKTTTELLWQREEKETYEFNERQLELLAPFQHKLGDWWFSKDEDGLLSVQEEKPEKIDDEWFSYEGKIVVIDETFQELFEDYDWETEPIQIKDIFNAGKNT